MEEFGSYSEGFEDIQQEGGAEWAEWWKEALQQAISRIEKEQKKAAQTRGQIQAQKKKNNAFALFLTFLLKHLNNDKILIEIQRVFFAENTWWPYKNVNHNILVGLFAPFYRKEIEHFGLHSYYEQLVTEKTRITRLSDYVSYLKKLSHHYHDNVAYDQQHLLQLIIYIINHFDIIDTNDFDDKQKKDLIISITHDLFGIQHTIDVKRVIL